MGRDRQPVIGVGRDRQPVAAADARCGQTLSRMLHGAGTLYAACSRVRAWIHLQVVGCLQQLNIKVDSEALAFHIAAAERLAAVRSLERERPIGAHQHRVFAGSICPDTPSIAPSPD